MLDVTALDLGRIAQDLQIRKVQVESVVHLLDEGNTVPFITRYRKERTGGLNEEIIRIIQRRIGLQRQLAERKQTILRSIHAQGKLTDPLQRAIVTAESPRRLEDLYLPFKPKKKTLASVAKDRGLEPLAIAIWTKDPAVAGLDTLWPSFVNLEKELPTADDVKQGVQHILAEQIAETAEVRDGARRVLWDSGKLVVGKTENLPANQGLDFKDYFEFNEPVRQIPPHRVLAINRGEKENVLRVKLEWNNEMLQDVVFHRLPLADHPHADFLKACTVDALQRLLVPSLEREIRRELTEHAEDHAVQVFSRNLRRLLLQPPVMGQRVLAIDPGFRTGCKLVALDEIGNTLDDGLFHLPQAAIRRDDRKGDKHHEKPGAAPPPAGTTVSLADAAPAAAASTEAPPLTPQPVTPPVDAQPTPAVAAETTPQCPPAEVQAAPSAGPAAVKRDEAKKTIEELLRKHNLAVVAIGNGTGCRETEEIVAEMIAERCPDLAYVIVNEAGASHYSASAVGREEFPNLDATVRGTISIGRRLQDPLSELVKIEPQNIGVGLYQHDLSEKRLKESLEGVIESCVNHVGVDLNTASVPLLRHVSGLNQLTARNIVDFRREHGPFKNRDQIRQVNGVGDATYTQAAGFLKIPGGENPLDSTWIHPESYPATQKLLTQMGYEPESLREPAKLEEMREKLKVLPADEVAKLLEIGVPTFSDIAEALSRPGRDPREDLPKPIFKKGILKLEDLKPAMELKGTVLNVVDFGAFVDVGLKDSGLVHISQLANRFVKSPYDVVAVGDVVTVWVLTVDQERRRVSLTMIAPGTERKPLEKRPAPQQQQQRRPQGPLQHRPSRPHGGHGRRHGPPPRPAAAVAQAAGDNAAQGQTQVGQETAAVATGATGKAAPPPRPQPQRPAPKPRRERPPPKLSDDQLQGAAQLHTFAELKALYDAKKPKDEK
jgi:protein Tex